MINDGTILGPNTYSNGHVRVYKFDILTNLWIQLGNDIDGVNREVLGRYVSINDTGNIISISSLAFQNTLGQSIGSVSLFEFDGLTWNQYGTKMIGLVNISIINYMFGWGATLNGNGNVIIIGDPQADSNSLVNNGTVKIFEIIDD